MDDVPLPAGFTELEQAAAELNKDHKIIGIVTDYLAPTPTKGTDWQLTMSIQSNEIGAFGMGHRVKFFALKDKLPPVAGVNDVVVLCNIRSKDYRGSVTFLSNHQTHCTVFPASSMPKDWADGCKLEYSRDQRSQQAKFVPDENVTKYSWMLWERMQYARPDVSEANQPSTDNSYLGKQGFQLIEKVRAGGFYDLIGQVVKLYDGSGGGAVTMYLTDYTFNPLLYNYPAPGETQARDGDEYGYTSRSDSKWGGPTGQFTLAIDLWDSHASYCRQKIREKEYVRLSNVQITFGKDISSKLEGKMRGDRNFPGKVNVRKVVYSDIAPDDDLKELIERKRDFIKDFGNWEKGEDHRGKKRKAQETSSEQTTNKRQAVCTDAKSDADVPESGEKLSKNQKKRLKDKEKRRRLAEVVAKTNRDHDKENVAPGAQNTKRLEAEGQDDPVIPKPRAQIRSEYNTLNANIVSGGQDERLWSIPELLKGHTPYRTTNDNDATLDYQRHKYCIEARVLDFWPPDIRDFARRERVSEFDILNSDPVASDPECEPIQEHEFSDASSDADGDDGPSSSALPADTPSSTYNANPEDDYATTMEQRDSARGYRWIWDFCLLLQDRHAKPGDPNSRLKVRILGDDGTFLLDMEPCNLHKSKNERILRRLEEKLFILWGNLQEMKEKEREKEKAGGIEITTQQEALAIRRPWMTGLTNRPFRCCVQEFGEKRLLGMKVKKGVQEGERVPVYEWKRRYFILETVIKS